MKITPIKLASLTALAILAYVWFLDMQGAGSSLSTYVIVGIVSSIVYYVTYITQDGR